MPTDAVPPVAPRIDAAAAPMRRFPHPTDHQTTVFPRASHSRQRSWGSKIAHGRGASHTKFQSQVPECFFDLVEAFST